MDGGLVLMPGAAVLILRGTALIPRGSVLILRRTVLMDGGTVLTDGGTVLIPEGTGLMVRGTVLMARADGLLVFGPCGAQRARSKRQAPVSDLAPSLLYSRGCPGRRRARLRSLPALPASSDRRPVPARRRLLPISILNRQRQPPARSRRSHRRILPRRPPRARSRRFPTSSLGRRRPPPACPRSSCWRSSQAAA